MTNTIKLHGLKKAIGDYRRANAGGAYSPRYGDLMLDRSTGEIWTDEHYDLGHGEQTIYHSDSIINLDVAMWREHNEYIEINMANVKAFCAEHYGIA